MTNRAYNYPHPVLSVDTNDFPGFAFQTTLTEYNDASDCLVLGFDGFLDCPGLESMIDAGTASVYVRVKCNRTSYRQVFRISEFSSFDVEIPKCLIADSLDVQTIVVASDAIASYTLPEFNEGYFGKMVFRIRKGDILAYEPGINIKLDSVLEKDMAGIVQVTQDDKALEMRVHYAAVEDVRVNETDYIYVILPKDDYYTYGKLRQKKYLKHGVERFLQASIVLPAITEAISLLRREEEAENPDDLLRHYKDTIWGQSLMASLEKIGIDDLLEVGSQSSFEIANRVLGNLTNDSLSNLLQKLTEWQTVREEDDVL